MALARSLARCAGVGALVVAALVPGVALADDSADEQARLHFTAGVNLLRDPSKARYEEAYAEFKRAYEFVPSYKILANVGLCAMKLERDAEAIDAYTKYLEQAKDLDPEERAQIERDLLTLKAGLAKIVLETRPDGASIQDTRIPSQGDPITNVYGPTHGSLELGIRRGHHVIKARFPGGVEQVWDVDITGGETHVFEQPADAPADNPRTIREVIREPSRPIPTSVFIAGGATLALGAGALVTGLVALDKHSQYQSANDGSDPRKADDLRSSGKTMNVVSDVLLVSTVIGAVATTYLYLTRPASAEPKVTTGVFVGPTGIAGRF